MRECCITWSSPESGKLQKKSGCPRTLLRLLLGSCAGGRLGLAHARCLPSMDAVNASETNINARDVGEQVCRWKQPRIQYGVLFEGCHAVGSSACGLAEKQ